MFSHMSGVPVMLDEYVSRGTVLAIGEQPVTAFIMHPLMHIELSAESDLQRWLREAEMWIIERANRQARAAAYRLDEMVDELNHA